MPHCCKPTLGSRFIVQHVATHLSLRYRLRGAEMLELWVVVIILLSLIAKYVTAAVRKQIFPLVACKGYYKSRSAAS
jgi:hypothetical protein